MNPGSGRGRAARIWRWTAGIAAGLLIAAALVVGALRLAIARVPENAARIQAWVEGQTDLHVEYDSLDARLRWFGPEIVLRGVRVLQRDGTETLFRTREGSVGLDLWSLFRSAELVAGRVRFVGPAVTVVRLPDGRIRLLGQDERPLDRPPFDFDRLPAGRVDVEDATVTYRDQVTGAAPLTLTRLNVRLVRKHGSTAAAGSARLPDALGRNIEFRGDLRGSIEHFDAMRGELELKADRLLFAGLAPLLPAGVARPAGGAGSIEAAIRFAQGKLSHARLDLGLENVELLLPPRDVPPVPRLVLSAPARPPGATPLSLPVVTSTIEWRPAATIPKGVHYALVRGTIRLNREGETWNFRARDLLLARPGAGRSRPAAFSVQWQGNAMTTFAATVHAQQVRLADAWPLALAFAPPGLDRWAGLDPNGEIRALDLEISRDRAGAWPRFTLAADVANLGFAATERSPGVAGLTGVVSGTDQRGRLALRATALALDLPRLFKEPIAQADLSGDVDWWRDGEAWVLDSRVVTVRHPGARARGSFQYRYESPRVSPRLALEVEVEEADVALAGRVMPYGILEQGSTSWLAPAFLAGRVDSGHLSYRGPTWRFPFRHGEGEFTATAEASGVGMDYFTGFAPLENGRGSVVFQNAGMVARLQSGETGGIRVEGAEVTIADFRRTVVEVDAKASGDLAKALPFVQRSPVGAELGEQFRGLTGKGRAQFAVRLHLPADAGAVHDIRIGAALHSATVGIPSLGAPVEQVTGDLEIHNLDVQARGLRGLMLGGPFELTVEPGSLSRETDAAVLLHARGLAMGAGVPAFIGLPAAIGMSGSLDWALEGRIERRRGTELWSSRYEVASNLAGLKVSAPEPFLKTAEEVRPTRVILAFAPEGLHEIAVDSGPARARLMLAQDRDGHLRLDRGIARMDGRPLALPDRPGLRFAGEWPAFDLGEWLALASDGGPGPTLSEWLGPTEVRVEKARIFGFEFTQVDATLKPQPSALHLHVTGPDAEGDVAIPSDLGSGAPIRFTMKRMSLNPVSSAADGATDEADPREVPALEMDAEDFAWQERRLGRVVARVAKDPNGLRLSEFTATTPDSTISGHGDWIVDGTGSRTRLAVELVSSDLGATSRELGIPGALEAKKTHAEASIGWSGGPMGEVLARMNGTVSLSLSEGQVRSLKPGAGRMLGLTSLAELPRRLSLDFHDVTDEGLAFDTVRGDFEIRDGNAYTRNLLLKGPAINIGIVGRTGLAAQDYDQTVVVSGNPIGPVTVAGALAGGPIGAAGGFLLSTLFKGQLQGLARVYYRITGPWADPVVERISAEAGAASTSAPSEAGAQP